MSPIRHWVIFLFLLVLLAALMLYPLIAEISAAVMENGRFTTHWLESALRNRTFQSQILNSLLLAVVVTVLCNVIAFPLALISRHFEFRGKWLVSAIVLVPMVLPPFVGAIGMRRLLGTFGSLTVMLQHMGILPHEVGIDWLVTGGFWSLAVLIALSLYPIAYLNLQASLANIDPAMLEAARDLGGGRWRNFLRITLPLAMPGVFAGSTLIFVWAFTELGTPLMLQYPNVVSRAIWDDVAGTVEGRTAGGYAKALVVMLIATAAFFIGKGIFGRSGHAMTSKAAVGATAVRLGWRGSVLAALPFVLVSFFAMLPHIGVVLYSFTAIAIEPASGWGPDGQFGWYRTVIPDRYTFAGYRAIFGTPEIYGAILNSLKYASIATVIDIVLGVSIAWVLVRTKVRGRGILDAVAMTPLAVPGIVMAFGFIAVLVQTGRSSILTTNPIWILVIAYSVRRLPYLVRSATGGLQQTSVTLEEAGANLGAGPWRVMWKITLPLILANIIAGALLTFAFAMLEVSDSLILARMPEHYPITKMINVLGTDTSGPENVRNACALGVVAMGLMTATILGATMLLGKKLGSLFRA